MRLIQADVSFLDNQGRFNFVRVIGPSQLRLVSDGQDRNSGGADGGQEETRAGSDLAGPAAVRPAGERPADDLPGSSRAGP